MKTGIFSGIIWPLWAVQFAAISIFAVYLFKRITKGFDASSKKERQAAVETKRAQAEVSQKQLEQLKLQLKDQEGRLKEALKMYNLVWDLAECLGFEQMKRVLERELKNTIPLLNAFSVYVKGAGGQYEPQIRHRLWIEGEKWAFPEGPLLNKETTKAFFHKDASGKNFVVVPISMGEKFLGYFIGDMTYIQPKAGSRMGPEEVLQFITILGDQLKFGILRATSFAKVEELSKIDSLTGLHRRGMFDRRIQEELVRAGTFKHNVCLMMLDIDHFKSLNDKWGHLFGDAVLKRVSAVIAQSVYETDFVARYGGEEFAIILPRADEAGALRKAETIRRKVEEEVFISDDRSVQIRCTISVGLAFAPQHANAPEQLISCADQALYASKSGGRNRVTTYTQLTDPSHTPPAV